METEKICEVCGKKLMAHYLTNGLVVYDHVTKRDSKVCIRKWLSKIIAERTERMLEQVW